MPCRNCLKLRSHPAQFCRPHSGRASWRPGRLALALAAGPSMATWWGRRWRASTGARQVPAPPARRRCAAGAPGHVERPDLSARFAPPGKHDSTSTSSPPAARCACTTRAALAPWSGRRAWMPIRRASCCPRWAWSRWMALGTPPSTPGCAGVARRSSRCCWRAWWWAWATSTPSEVLFWPASARPRAPTGCRALTGARRGAAGAWRAVERGGSTLRGAAPAR